MGTGCASDAKRWYQPLKTWWVAHRAARHDAKLATLRARWDATRETVRRIHADAAVDMIAPAHACAITTALCDLGA
jgi:hypothetical protein